jgi:hypothetical protein
MLKTNSTYCTLRWGYPIVDFGRGSIRTCCRTFEERVEPEEFEEKGSDIFLNSDYQIKMRLAHLKGYKNVLKSCTTCWRLEDGKIESPRLPEWLPYPYSFKDSDKQLVKEFTDKELGEITLVNYVTNEELKLKDITLESDILRSERPFMLEVLLSTYCDLKCSYCSPQFSTKWAEEALKFGDVDKGYMDWSKPHIDSAEFEDSFWLWFDDSAIHSLDRIGMVGGEPMIQPNLFSFLDRMMESYNRLDTKKKPILWFVTNLNASEKIIDRFYEYLPKLCEVFQVEVHASIESFGKKAEYIRFGLNCDRFVRNANKLCSYEDKKNFHFGFQIANNSMSITGLLDFIKVAKDLQDTYKRGITLKHNIVTIPEFHSPMILTKDFAKYLDEVVDYLEKLPVKRMLPVPDPLGTWKSFLKWITNIRDSIKNQEGEKIDWVGGDVNNIRASFYKWFKQYDERREVNFLEVFPEYKEFYNLCKELCEVKNGII